MVALSFWSTDTIATTMATVWFSASIRKTSAKRWVCHLKQSMQARGGPTFKDCFELLRRVSARPGTDIAKLLDAAIFNLVIGNADAHGKNFSILYDHSGPRMAPLYDLLSTVAYPDLSPKLAMWIGERATLADMDADGWQAFSKETGVSLPLVRRRVKELTDATGDAIPRLLEDMSPLAADPLSLNRVAALIADRAKLVALSI